MDPTSRIETEHGFEQHGHAIDVDDMATKLASEESAGPYVSRSRVLVTMGLIFAAAGGALVGWPLGQKLGGNEQPAWGLAYAGVGAIAVSFPLVIWGGSSMHSAVEAHNRGLPPISP